MPDGVSESIMPYDSERSIATSQEVVAKVIDGLTTRAAKGVREYTQ